MCGLGAEDRSPYDGSFVRLTVGLRVPRENGGAYARDNSRTLCGDCADGLDNLPFMERPSADSLAKLLQQLPESEQRWLLQEMSKWLAP